MNKDDLFMIFGKVTTTASVSYGKIAKKVVKEIGYVDDCIELEKISKQSPDISIGVTGSSTHKQEGGDQGMMVGFACNER